MDAETAYLFRHALVRDAAYELQPVTDRALLHGLAVDVLEDRFGGTPEIESPHWLAPLRAHESDSYALELARHARLASVAVSGTAGKLLLRKSAIYLRRAANLDREGYRNPSAMKLYEQLQQHPGADEFIRADAHLCVGQLHYRLGNVLEAGEEYEKARRLIPESDKIGRMLVKGGITIVGSHEDNGPHVAEAHHEAAEFWRGIGDLRRQVGSLINYAVWHCEEGDLDVARNALEQAIELAREHGHPRYEEAALGTLALIDDRQGRHAEAEAGLRRALAIAAAMDNLGAELNWACALAARIRDAQRLDHAEDVLRDVIERAPLQGLVARVDYARAQLAGVLALAGRVDEARKLWNLARAALVARKDEYLCRVSQEEMNVQLEKAGLPELLEDGTFPD